jgi:hypothetical protein
MHYILITVRSNIQTKTAHVDLAFLSFDLILIDIFCDTISTSIDKNYRRNLVIYIYINKPVATHIIRSIFIRSIGIIIVYRDNIYNIISNLLSIYNLVPDFYHMMGESRRHLEKCYLYLKIIILKIKCIQKK